MTYCHLHVHSHYSALDAMGSPAEIVSRAKKNGQPGIGLTDHGVMSGVFRLYKQASRAGLAAFPGIEAYLVHDITDKTAHRYHLTLISYTATGYKNLVKITTRSHQRDHYHYKPLIDFADLAELSTEGIVALSGCWFGYVQQAFAEHAPDLYAGRIEASKRAAMLAGWFDTFWIELQDHNRDPSALVEHVHDNALNREMVGIANEIGVPYTITNDAHYCDMKDKPLHDFYKAMAYGADPGDVAFPGDSYHLATTWWMRDHYPEDIWDGAQYSYEWLLDNYEPTIPILDKYKYSIPTKSKTPHLTLSLKVRDALTKKGLTSARYQDRLDSELGVIRQTGMAAYFLLVADYCDWARKQGILVNARGSANASLVCWMLNITALDPIRWKLDFDRFLTADRAHPPDIDIDVEDERREEVIDYLRRQHEVVQIGSFSRLGYDEEGGRGSLFVSYMGSERRRLGDHFKTAYQGVESVNDLPPTIREQLKELTGFTLYKSSGAHAAGYLLGSKARPVHEWVPTLLIPSSGSVVTQMTMEDVEDAGYLKVDVLGLRTLSVVKTCLEFIGQEGWDWIPLNDSATFTLLRRGEQDTGIFQFEGWASAKGCRELAVKSVHDLVAVNALYRPAAKSSGYTAKYLAGRRGASVRYPHPIFEKHLTETYGVPAFQEQVLAILRDMGMDSVSVNRLLKAIKASQAKQIVDALETFDETYEEWCVLCEKIGMTDEASDFGWSLLEGFALYGFNRAHATAYALLGYYTAYLKAHHPLEYQTALLMHWIGTPKETPYVRQTRAMGIKLLPAHVNVSAASYALDTKRQGIRRGLVSIAHVGWSTAIKIVQGQPYLSVSDFAERSHVSGSKSYLKNGDVTGAIEALQKAGALAGLPE